MNGAGITLKSSVFRAGLGCKKDRSLLGCAGSHSDGTPNPKILVAGPESVVRREKQAEHGCRCTYLGKADVSPCGRRPNHTGFANTRATWRRASRAQRLPHNSASFSTQSDPKLGCEKQGCLGTAIYARVTYASPLPGPSQNPPSWEHPQPSEVEVVTVSHAQGQMNCH